MTGGWTSLSLRGLGVIDEAEVDLGPGLTVITGETGAGKTMVVTGLGLLLGGRTDASMVRHGYPSAVIEGRFRADGPDVDGVLADSGGERDEDGTVLVSRIISAEGRSRAHLAGRSVPAATLVRMGEFVVAVHGQDDQQRLRQPAQQRHALDRFGGATITALLSEYRAAFAEAVELGSRLDDVIAHSRERARESAELADLLAMIDALEPRPGEEAALRAESQRLAHIEEIAHAVARAQEGIDGGGADGGGTDGGLRTGARDQLGEVVAALARAAEHDPGVGDLAGRAGRVLADLDDLAAGVARLRDDLDADPSRIAYVEERRAALSALRRRLAHDDTSPIDDLASWRASAADRLAELSDDATLVEELRAARESACRRAAEAAGRLSLARQEAAAALSDAVTGELAALAMPRARLEVAVLPREGAAPLTLEVQGARRPADRHGIDDVEFLLAARPDAPARPLAKAASGGERSRVMLALEVVFAGLDPVPTFVFDEVDAGVGGKAAVEVGQRLAMLARSAQVVVVTHLAQVAAFADRHLVVRPGPVTAASVGAVTGEERLREIARMLGGLEDSPTAAAHAEELLELAATRMAAGRSGGRARQR